MKKRMTALEAVFQMKRLVFSSRDVASFAGLTIASATQSLARLAKKGIVKKIMHGLWGLSSDRRFTPHAVIPFLNANHQAYLSFTSALHMHGIISQAPRVITVASTAHSRMIHTTVGDFEVHQIAPEFFDGFDWSEGDDYLVATPEKALVDCLYLASRRKRQFAHFPEMDIDLLDEKKVIAWARGIKSLQIRNSVMSAIARIFSRNA